MYNALVCRLSDKRPVPGRDRIILASASGYDVLVGANHLQEDKLGVYFPAGGQLSDDMCRKLQLYKTDPDTGEKWPGYFDSNRKVGVLKFKDCISTGMWIEMEKLATLGDISTLKEGDEFDSISGQIICEKYFSRATREARLKKAKRGPVVRKRKVDLEEHYDTAQIRNGGVFPVGASLYYTEKLHGTSGRTGYVECLNPPYPEKDCEEAFWPISNLALRIRTITWDVVSGSRRVILKDTLGDSSTVFTDGWYGDNFRREIHDKLKSVLRKGETFYYEIVGYTETGKSIMPSHVVEDKALAKEIGKVQTYSYGCKPGEYAVYVYRITQNNRELTWAEVDERIYSLSLPGLYRVPILFTGIFSSKKELIQQCKTLTEAKTSILDHTHIPEGVCVRAEIDGRVFPSQKYKGNYFTYLEGITSNDVFLDTEDAS